MDAIELFTYLFLVLSGLIVGYWLFYRDRSHEESVRNGLKKENNELRRSLQASQAAFESLDEKFGRQRGQLNVLQKLCDDWSSSREISERERAQLEADVSAKSSRISEIESDYRDEKSKRVALEDQIHQLSRDMIHSKAEVEEQWRGKHAEAESSLNKRLVDLEAIKGDRKQLNEKLHTATARIAELESEIESSKSLIKTATTNATGLKEEYVSLETGLKSTNDQLKQAQSDLAKAVSQKEAAMKETAEAEKCLAIASTEAERLSEQNCTLQQKLETTQSALTSTQEQLALVTQQRDQSMDQEKAAGVVANGLQKRLDNQESTIHALRQNQDDALENLKHELSVRAEIESRFDSRLETMRADYEAQIEALKTEEATKYKTRVKELREQLARQASQYAEHSRDLRAQLAEQSDKMSTLRSLESEAATYTSSIVKLDAKREQLKQELDATREQMQAQLKQDSETIGKLQSERNDLRAELEQLHLQIDPLQQKVDSQRTFKTELQMAQTRVAELERQQAQREQESKRLRAQANELERLRQRYQESRERQDKLQLQLDEMVSRQIARESERTNNEARILELEAQLSASLVTVEDLRKERALVLATLADQRQSEAEATIIAFTQSLDASPTGAEDYDPEYRGRTRRDANRGVVFTETPESCDDLKRISGIAEVLEKRLNDFGVYTFKQIMEWKPVEIEEFSRLLAFRDRIERDDWQGQARFFYNQKRKGIRSVA